MVHMSKTASGILLYAISGFEVSASMRPEQGRYLGLDLDLDVAHLGLHNSPSESNTEMNDCDRPNFGSLTATYPTYSDMGIRLSTST